jgi:perosamine synthetase
MVTVIPDEDFGVDKFAFQSALRERNIDSRPFFSRLSTLEAYRDFPEALRFLPERPAGDRPSTYGVNLPSGYHMTEEKVETVVRAVRDTLRLPAE